jgi:hypothetical protein
MEATCALIVRIAIKDEVNEVSFATALLLLGRYSNVTAGRD